MLREEVEISNDEEQSVNVLNNKLFSCQWINWKMLRSATGERIIQIDFVIQYVRIDRLKCKHAVSQLVS